LVAAPDRATCARRVDALGRSRTA